MRTIGPVALVALDDKVDAVTWFLRAIQLQDGRWSCRHGALEYDDHDHLDQAVAHLRMLAEELGPSRFFVHRYDGGIERLGYVD